MKILVSAYGCSSRGGSEGYFGWAAVCCLSQDHDLWVLTSPRNRPDLSSAQAASQVPDNVRFIYIGRPPPPWPTNRMLARFQDWREYRTFSLLSQKAAAELHRQVNFDLVHHVTIATWRIGPPLWSLRIPFVFGPVGGYERFPIRFFSILSSKAAAFELLRMFSNTISRVSLSVRRCIQEASVVLAANPETRSILQKIRKTDEGVGLLSPGFYSAIKASTFAGGGNLRDSGRDARVRFFAGGSLEGRKGIAMALRALAAAKEGGLRFTYRIGGGGPEREYLQSLARRLQLEDNDVIFGEPLSGDSYIRELASTHIFLLPSLRESAGLTMMEAMLAGCMPIVANCGSPALIVTDECGYRLAVSNPGTFVRELTTLLLHLDASRETIFSKGLAAAHRIQTLFNDQHYRHEVAHYYADAMRR